jgi:hypothetical protein
MDVADELMHQLLKSFLLVMKRIRFINPSTRTRKTQTKTAWERVLILYLLFYI